MNNFNELLEKAKAKGYKPLYESHTQIQMRIWETMLLYVWFKTKTRSGLELVFIEGIEPEKQVEALIEEIDKL